VLQANGRGDTDLGWPLLVSVGVDPIYGVFTVIFPAMFYAVLGQSKQGAVGPMSIPCLIIAATVDKHTDDGDPTAPGQQAFPLQSCLLTPEIQWQPRGKRVLQGGMPATPSILSVDP
jgi:hypothetical protein